MLEPHFSPRKVFFWRRAERHCDEGDGRPVMAGQSREREDALNKLVTSKFPASAVLMQLSILNEEDGAPDRGTMGPQEGSREADALADGDCTRSNPALRIPITSWTLICDIVPAALDAGRPCQRAKEWGDLLERGEEEQAKIARRETQGC